MSKYDFDDNKPQEQLPEPEPMEAEAPELEMMLESYSDNRNDDSEDK